MVCVCGELCVGSVSCVGGLGWAVILQKVTPGGISEMEGECLGDAEAELLHGVDLRSRCGV